MFSLHFIHFFCLLRFFSTLFSFKVKFHLCAYIYHPFLNNDEPSSVGFVFSFFLFVHLLLRFRFCPFCFACRFQFATSGFGDMSAGLLHRSTKTPFSKLFSNCVVFISRYLPLMCGFVLLSVFILFVFWDVSNVVMCWSWRENMLHR